MNTEKVLIVALILAFVLIAFRIARDMVNDYYEHQQKMQRIEYNIPEIAPRPIYEPD